MSRGIQRFKSMKGFAGHRSGGGGKFLSKWKENGNAAGTPGCTGSLETWMHRKELPMAVYRHAFPQIVVKEDKDDKTKKVVHVWSKNFVCHETTATLEGQYFRERETGLRKHPPERCGACKLVEWCYQQCLAYEETRKLPEKKRKGINFTTPMFRFVSEDCPDENQTLHVGGVCNMLGKDLDDAKKQDLKDAKISLKWTWKENGWAKCQYAIFIVDQAHPESGVQIAVEAQSLGEKIQGVLNTELENEVDIQKTPYCIRWQYFEKETDLNKKYAAIPLRKIKPSPRIMKLITDEPPPLPDDLTVPFNQQALRMTLEAHCLLPKGVVPWDELFPSKAQSDEWVKEDKAEAAAEAKEAAEETEGDDAGSDSDEEESDDDASDSDEEESDDEDEMFECDNEECKQPVKASDKKCPHCGHVFEVVDEEEEEPEPEPEVEKPKMRTRSEAIAAKKAAGGGGGGSGKGKKSKVAAPMADDVEFDNQGDEIPFLRDMTLSGLTRV